VNETDVTEFAMELVPEAFPLGGVLVGLVKNAAI